MPTAGRRTLDELLAEASSRIDRLEPAQARAEAVEGALLVDIRSQDARKRQGAVPGSIHIPRTVLEWRVDPESRWRNPHVGGLDCRVILLCDHGCSSVLAAATLVELGFSRAADVIGGFAAWKRAGLPVGTPRAQNAGGLSGMEPPEPW